MSISLRYILVCLNQYLDAGKRNNHWHWKNQGIWDLQKKVQNQIFRWSYHSDLLYILVWCNTHLICCTRHDNPYVKTQTAKRGAKFHIISTPFCCIWRYFSGACVFYQQFNLSLLAKPQRGPSPKHIVSVYDYSSFSGLKTSYVNHDFGWDHLLWNTILFNADLRWQTNFFEYYLDENHPHRINVYTPLYIFSC